MRKSILTATILTGLLLSACADNTQTERDVSSTSKTSSVSVETAPKDLPGSEDQTAAASSNASTMIAENPALAEQYQGLDPRDVSRAEIEELIELEKETESEREAFQKSLKAWRESDPSIRGEAPVWRPTPCGSESGERKQLLDNKIRKANIRKGYENTPPDVLSKDEIEELITLEQQQLEKSLGYQNKVLAWSCKDAATRGQQPDYLDAALLEPNPRLRELQGKIESVAETKDIKERIKNLSEAHKISMSDSEISELMRLEREQDKIEMELQKAVMKAAQEGKISGQEMSEMAIMESIPKQALQGMMDAQLRMQAIKGPLEAAEKADRIRNDMMALSQESGVAILSGEITETIDLRAEKDRIENKTMMVAAQKWIDGDGPIFNDVPLPSDVDYARLKEIDARLKAISAPMTDAKNAIAEANDPALKLARLEREERQKWKDDWQDRKQSGEIPMDADLISPSYFELQDRVEDYRTKIKARAEKVGYYLSEIELNRLDELNDEMLDIRKQVHEMEVDGSSTLDESFGYKPQAFGVTAGMYKIGLIKGKQRELLAELIEAEAVQAGATQSDSNEAGSRQFNQSDFGEISGQFDRIDGSGAETIIESFRAREIEVPQSEADDLLDFEREFKDRK